MFAWDVMCIYHEECFNEIFLLPNLEAEIEALSTLEHM